MPTTVTGSRPGTTDQDETAGRLGAGPLGADRRAPQPPAMPPTQPGPDPVGGRPWHRITRSGWITAAIAAMTAVLYSWNLSSVGYGNSYYAAAVKSATVSWKAFFFGSIDPGSFITVDKPPVALWVQALSARLFGFSSWSMLLPEAAAGVASVLILHHLVRKWAGDVAAHLAAVALALTPVAVLMFRYNNPDAILTLLCLGAAWALWSAVETGRTRALHRLGPADRLGLRHQDAPGLPGAARLHRRLPAGRSAPPASAHRPAGRRRRHPHRRRRLVDRHRRPLAGRRRGPTSAAPPTTRSSACSPATTASRDCSATAAAAAVRVRPAGRAGGGNTGFGGTSGIGAAVQHRARWTDRLADPDGRGRSARRLVADPTPSPHRPQSGRMAAVGRVGARVRRRVQPLQGDVPPVLHGAAGPGRRRPRRRRRRGPLAPRADPPIDGVGPPGRHRGDRRLVGSAPRADDGL